MLQPASTDAVFPFIVSLAAVINGLGIVAWLSGLADYLQRRGSIQVSLYWPYILSAVFQLLLHVLFWWSMWSIRSVQEFDFLDYLYVLAGPTLLYLASSILRPPLHEDIVNLRAYFDRIRRIHGIIMALAWLWALFLWPVLIGYLDRAWSMFALFFLVTLLQIMFADRRIRIATVLANWALLAVLIWRFQLQMGA